MSMVKPVVYDGGFQRQVQQGDVVAGGEVIGTLATVGAATFTAQQFTTFSIISRSGSTAAYNDTTPSAQDIIAALAVNGQTPMQGTSYRLRILNTVAFAETMVAGTGVTLSGNTVNAASSWRDYLITLTNTTPAVIIPANSVTNGSAIITGMTLAQTGTVSAGMAVSGTGIPANTTVLSVQPGVGITLSANATATGSLVALTLTPTVSIAGIGGGSL